MSTEGVMKAEATSMSFSVILSPNKDASGRGNFPAHSKNLSKQLGPKHPRIAKIFLTNQPYELPELTEEDWLPPPVPGAGAYSDAHRREMYGRAWAGWRVEHKTFQKEKETVYNHIWNSLSEDSQGLVKVHRLYRTHLIPGIAVPPQPHVEGEEPPPPPPPPQDIEIIGAFESNDCNILWAIIIDTHVNDNNGPDGANRARHAKRALSNGWMNFKQAPTQTVTEFKSEFDDYLILLAAARIPQEADIAMTFLDKLDPMRHDDMRVDMQNAAIDTPNTLEGMYEKARTWKPKVAAKLAAGVAADKVHTFLTSDQLCKATAPPPPKKEPKKDGRNEERRNNRRDRAAGGANASAYKPKDEKEAKLLELRRAIAAKAIERARVGDAPPRGEKAGCFLCGDSDHRIGEQCKAMQTLSTTELVDMLKTYTLVVLGDEVIDIVSGEKVACNQLLPSGTADKVPILFSDTEVLLDNAAGSHIFRDASLLTNMRRSAKTLSLNGISGVGFDVRDEGDFRDLCTVGHHPRSVANILSQTTLKDAGCRIELDDERDEYLVIPPGGASAWLFVRKLNADGVTKSKYYTCDMDDADSSIAVLVDTVAENERRYTVGEVKKANAALKFMERLGHISPQGAIDVINGGVLNNPVTASDVRNAIAIRGVSVPAMKGKTTRKTSTPATNQLVGPRVTQQAQTADGDLFWWKGFVFLLLILTPLGLNIVQHIRDRSAETVGASLRTMVSLATSRGFDVREIRFDGEGALAPLVPYIHLEGIVVNIAGPGEHVARAEREIRFMKEKARAIEHGLPYVMPHIMIPYCVLFAASRANLQPNASSLDKVSPMEQFSGHKLDCKKDVRVAFGDLCQAVVAETDNTPSARTQGCIALLPTGNSTGSVKMWHMATNRVVTRDQFTIQPMPDDVIAYITGLAAKQGYTRGADDPTASAAAIADDAVDRDLAAQELAAAHAKLPEMIPIDGRRAAVGVLPTPEELLSGPAPEAGVMQQQQQQRQPVHDDQEGSGPLGSQLSEDGLRWSARLSTCNTAVPILFSAADVARSEVRKQLLRVSDWHDTAFALKVSVRRAMRDQPAKASAAIMAELMQMIKLKVWHPVHYSSLSAAARKAILRTTMFLKEKFTADGVFEKLKARLVAGGDQQDKELYDNLSSPTAATSSVLAVAAIAAAENRHVMTIDVGGAFLNADMAATGIKVHVRLDKTMTRMLLDIAPEYQRYMDSNETVLVQLDKALYGCVEAAALWYENLSSALIADGFCPNEYDQCVFNKTCADGEQITLVLHVDDLMVTSAGEANLDAFSKYLRTVYPEVTEKRGRVVNYVGMTFDYTVAGQVSVTMDQCVKDILNGCGVVSPKSTPATENLFEVRAGAAKATASEAKYFHTHVAKMLYLSKRVRPECLTAVSFLSTRVQACDVDDMRKLERLLGYLAATQDRGIVLRIGDNMTVSAYIDAAYGVHTDSGKSHTGCAIVLGGGGPVFVKSAKQKIVTKSSTEAELVGLSDTASQALHLRNFVIAQGYEVGPAVLYQDNLSCMALMKRGGPGSERSRHINIRHFWVHEKVEQGEVVIEHLSTDNMWANALTKPVQGAQFVKERAGLTNWM